jgi:hypothetical protein
LCYTSCTGRLAIGMSRNRTDVRGIAELENETPTRHTFTQANAIVT